MKKSRSVRWLKISSGILLFLFVYFVWMIYSPVAGEGEMVVTILPGASTRAIGRTLSEQGVIRSESLFIVYVKLLGYGDDLKAGEYRFKNPSLYRVVMNITAGVPELQTRLMFIEGWTRGDMAEAFAEGTGKSADEFLAATDASARAMLAPLFSFLAEAPEDATLEGYLFPDTYFVKADATAAQVVMKMLANFDEKASTLLASASERGAQSFDVVIVASIVEREVRTPEDMRLASGVFWKRLSLGMPLQADSTVNFVTGSKNPSLTFAETGLDTPYNTYRFSGLPPGPISNPGIEALRAASDPKSSSYLYFLTTKEGQTIFNATFEEHVRAKEKYL